MIMPLAELKYYEIYKSDFNALADVILFSNLFARTNSDVMKINITLMI